MDKHCSLLPEQHPTRRDPRMVERVADLEAEYLPPLGQHPLVPGLARVRDDRVVVLRLPLGLGEALGGWRGRRGRAVLGAAGRAVGQRGAGAGAGAGYGLRK